MEPSDSEHNTGQNAEIKIPPGSTICQCIRCGTCCKKGGPSLHLEDKHLIENGIILVKHLFTFRKGEPAYDNIQGILQPAPSDIIKIKGRKGTGACVFFEEAPNRCTIYKNRPVECRVLKCWDTRKIEQIYSVNRLTRKDLLATIEGLWDLIEVHQQQCDFEKIRQLTDDSEELHAVLRYDIYLRELLVQKGGIQPDMTEFLFGRPLLETIGMFGKKSASPSPMR